ncbi:hypothetical protein [Methylococcus mesophilus]|uniref:hypothetical protein n=1 Tax=Methylococcus mesophilus TaxID=2993564 RepID=UPI00224B0C66|nr:hypothetical protein [Methylococcus mesophilus]UZR27228.1 hypothetical protein OOT43_10820 [Methylococcus mesophilus]
MKNLIVPLSISSLVVAFGVGAPLETADAASVCYTIQGASTERIVIDVEKQGGLVNPWVDLVASVFGGKQTAYSAHGKHVFAPIGYDFVAIAAATGTVDVSAPNLLSPPATNAVRPSETGAHMGLVAHWANLYGGKLVSFPVTFNCGSLEVSPTPKIWRCNIINESRTFNDNGKLLTKVNMADDVRLMSSRREFRITCQCSRGLWVIGTKSDSCRPYYWVPATLELEEQSPMAEAKSPPPCRLFRNFKAGAEESNLPEQWHLGRCASAPHQGVKIDNETHRVFGRAGGGMSI